MTNRLLRTLVVVTLTLITSAVPRAQTPVVAPAPGAAQAPPSPPAAPPPPQAPAPGSADAVYAIGRDRISPPRVQREIKPSYTAEAMRNRVQGSVRLQGVVERDGTISGVTIVQSLDSQFGLDQAAVDALKQWRFQPGALPDGTPVRVLVNVDLTFTLRDRPPTQGWPEGFAEATSSPGAVEEASDHQGLRIRLARPAAWSVRRDGPASEWIGLRSADSAASLSVFRPDSAAFDLSAAAPDTQLPKLVEMMRRLQSPQVETVATGQVQASPDAFWVWSAFRIPAAASLPGVPANTVVGEARSWVFARTANDKVVLVQCTAILPRDVDPAALPSRLQQLAAEFAPIVKSIRVEPVAN